MNARSALTVAETEPSTRLRVVAGYFSVIGTLGAVYLVVFFGFALSNVATVGIARDAKVYAQLPTTILAIVTQLWTASALRNKRRAGWYGALAALGLPIVLMAVKQSVYWPSIITSAVGLALLASVRNELE